MAIRAWQYKIFLFIILIITMFLLIKQKARQVYNKSNFKYWSHLSDLNGRPTDYKSVALPAELKWHIQLVTPTGIEPMSPPWKGDVLTAWPRGQ